jgi:hypothetical protein
VIQGWEVAVNQKQHKHLSAICQCGKVKFEAVGPPILTGSCYCTSCQEAGRGFEELASAPSVLDPDSGSGFILYRKDRVQCAMGQEYLEEHRLKPDSSTRRVVATCCNSAMFLDVTKGHWLSMYRNRFPTGAPPLEMRLMTKERRVCSKHDSSIGNTGRGADNQPKRLLRPTSSTAFDPKRAFPMLVF